jgi:hypothetical protein
MVRYGRLSEDKKRSGRIERRQKETKKLWETTRKIV